MCDNKFPLRKSFFINEQNFQNMINNFKPIGKNEERRKLFKNIIYENKNKLIYFLSNL